MNGWKPFNLKNASFDYLNPIELNPGHASEIEWGIALSQNIT